MRYPLVAAAAIATLALAGCSSSGSSADSSSKSLASANAVASSKAMDEMKSAYASGENEDANPEAADPDADTSEPTVVKVGQSYTVTNIIDDSKQKVSVKSMECGTKSSLLAIGHADDGGDTNVHPEAGMQFCIVRGSVTNAGKIPMEQFTSAVDTVTSPDGTAFQATEDDGSAASTLAGDDGLAPGYSTDVINPGITKQWVGVYDVPKDMRPTYIAVSGDGDSPVALLALPTSNS